MASNRWQDDFFSKPKRQSKAISLTEEELELQKKEKEVLKKVKTHNNKCFRKLLETLYVRLHVIKFLFNECIHKGRNTICFNNLRFHDLNLEISRCDIWIDKIGKTFKWKQTNANDTLLLVETYIRNLYEGREDDEFNILHYSSIGNLLAIDLKALIFKSVAINAMVIASNILLPEDVVVNLHKNVDKLIRLSKMYSQDIDEIYSDASDEIDIDIDNHYNKIYDKLQDLANFNVTLKDPKEEIKKIKSPKIKNIPESIYDGVMMGDAY